MLEQIEVFRTTLRERIPTLEPAGLEWGPRRVNVPLDWAECDYAAFAQVFRVKVEAGVARLES
jgi:hypothetical protein